MREADLRDLLERISCGDGSAFQTLLEDFQPLVQNFIGRHLNRRADQEDILQETFFNVYRALRGGQYRHINLAAFKQWLRTIAWNLVIYANVSQKNAPESLSYVDSQGEQVFLDIPDEQENPERRLTQTDLAGFLEQQLDEVLIKSEPTPSGKDLGLLKKLAFMRFYVDQLTQKEVVAMISEYGARLQMAKAVNQATINNWLSRGDIIKGLVRHLVAEHYDFVQQVLGRVIDRSLDPGEKQRLQDHWHQPQDRSDSAPRQSAAADDLKYIRKKLSESLFQHIKKQLHDFRHPGN